jgi:LysM repeat protein
MAQDNQSYFLHTVQAGQTLYSISNMYNVSVAQITAINPDCTQMIYVGEVLRIPQNTASADYFFHTIKGGATRSTASRWTYKVSAKDICDLNPGPRC